MTPSCYGCWITQKNQSVEVNSENRLRAAIGLLAVLMLNLGLGERIAQGGDCLFDVNFQNCEINRVPAHWKAHDVKCAGKVYSVQNESGKKFLRADSQGTKDQIGYEVHWPLREFPMLQWQWRAVHFPTGSDERVKSRNDSVLGLYVIFGHFPFIKTIKYVWSDTLPVGSCFPSPYSSTTRIVVIRSGRTRQGTWVTESRDVLADYIRFYGEEEKNPVALGIGLLTDSDDTRSRAVGDYAEFKALPPDTMQLAGP